MEKLHTSTYHRGLGAVVITLSWELRNGDTIEMGFKKINRNSQREKEGEGHFTHRKQHVQILACTFPENFFLFFPLFFYDFVFLLF